MSPFDQKIFNNSFPRQTQSSGSKPRPTFTCRELKDRCGVPAAGRGTHRTPSYLLCGQTENDQMEEGASKDTNGLWYRGQDGSFWADRIFDLTHGTDLTLIHSLIDS